MKAILFDYGAGNLHSLVRALERVGCDVRAETDAAKCAASNDFLILPGVGAFGLAAQALAPGRERIAASIRDGRPCLGICLGMQLFFEESAESPGRGLGVLGGAVTRLEAAVVPHIGWTAVEGRGPMYFAHSFACRTDGDTDVVAWAQHENDRFPAIIRRKNLVGTQFHPEKSSTAGLALLRELTELATQ